MAEAAPGPCGTSALSPEPRSQVCAQAHLSRHAPLRLGHAPLVHVHTCRVACAVTALQRARTGGLREADNLRYLAYALHHTGDSAGALNVCNDWMQLAPSGNAAGYRALLQMDNGDMASAVIAARDLAAAEPDNGNANLILGLWAAERQDIDDAAHRFERLVQTEPGSSRVWLGLALVQMLRQDCPGAIGSFRQALSLDPGNVGTLVALGWAQFTQDDFTAAEETFRHAIRVERNFGEAHGGLAAALVRQNRREEARRSIALARGLDSKGFGLVYARSVLMALEGRRDQGVQLMARNLERSVRPDGRTLMDGIRVFLRSRMSAAPGSTGQPRATPPRRLPVRR